VPQHKIRELNESDVTWIYEACQDEQIQYWTTIPKPYLLEHAKAFVNGEFPEYKIWAIENENKEPVGVISIHSVDDQGDADLGYWISPKGRGRGATKDAINLVEHFAQSDSKIKSLVACISDQNIFSQKAAEAAGLKRSEVANKTCPAGCSQTSATVYRKAL
jgi:RimJ/RimL family protein N-acetyltransferase